MRLLELNLRSTPYWWSTRLYLQAALCEDESQIEAFVFVDDDAVKRYWGMATPKEVRNALATQYTYLETIYAKSPADANGSERAGDRKGFVEAVVTSWVRGGHFREFAGGEEEAKKTFVTSREVVKWGITQPLLDSVEWEGVEDTRCCPT